MHGSAPTCGRAARAKYAYRTMRYGVHAARLDSADSSRGQYGCACALSLRAPPTRHPGLAEGRQRSLASDETKDRWSAEEISANVGGGHRDNPHRARGEPSERDDAAERRSRSRMRPATSLGSDRSARPLQRVTRADIRHVYQNTRRFFFG